MGGQYVKPTMLAVLNCTYVYPHDVHSVTEPSENVFGGHWIWPVAAITALA
jgi:hypothetical protein